jgi:hypothetical protein
LGSIQAKKFGMNKLIYSTGLSVFFYDILDQYFQESLKTELQNIFQQFSSATPSTNPNPFVAKEKKPSVGTVISFNQFEAAVTTSKWEIVLNNARPIDLFERYDVNGDYFLEFKELAYMAILENLKVGQNSQCTACLKDIRNELNNFY